MSKKGWAVGLESTREAIEIVRQRLHECRELLLDASRACVAEAGPDAWERADAFFSLAKQLEMFRQRLDRPVGEQQGDPVIPVPRSRKVGGKRLSRGSRETKKKKSDYPKYAVEDNALVKYGLSRDRRKEYRHVVPRESFEKVASRVESLSSGGEFTAEDVETNLSLPSYQLYTVLALLRDKGVLAVPRRGYYILAANNDARTGSIAVWRDLCGERTRNIG